MLFDQYWRAFGLPLSRLKGALIDPIPFSLVEAALWLGTAATLLFIVTFLPVKWFGGAGESSGWSSHKALRVLKGRAVRRLTFIAGPVFLIALGLGQGAFPGSLAPTAWRTPLAERLAESRADTLPEEAFRAWVAAREARLIAAFGDSLGRTADSGGAARWRAFQAMSETEVLAACDTSLNAVLAALDLPDGRTVRAFKTMGPWTATIGLAYGGPAFHDPFFGEIAIIGDADMPAPRYWRFTAACHEAAHAKGFTREMDAEILTQLALARTSDQRLQALADIHFLRKAGVPVAWPRRLIEEVKRVRLRRAEVEAGQPVVRALRRAAEGIGFQNSGGKYGARRRDEAWNPRHPFFATVHGAQPRVSARTHGGQSDTSEEVRMEHAEIGDDRGRQ